MIIGSVQLAAPYAAGSGYFLCRGLSIVLPEMDAIPTRVTLYQAATYGTPGQVSTTYAIDAIGGNTIALGGVLAGTDQAYKIGDLVALQLSSADISGGGGGGSGTVNSASSGHLAGYTSTGTTVSGITVGSGLSLSGSTLTASGGGGSGTVSSAASGDLAGYSATGTTVSGVTVGTGLALSSGNLTASGTPISSLTALGATPANNDLIPMLDVDDTTMASSGTTKSMTVAEVNTYVQSAAAFQSLTTTGTSGAATLTSGVLNIPTPSGGGGSGTVGSGTTGQIAYYGSAGTTVGGTSTITIDSNSNLIITPVSGPTSLNAGNVFVDTAQNCLGVYQASVRQDIGGVIAWATGTGTANTGTTRASLLTGMTVAGPSGGIVSAGVITLPANLFKVGKILRVTMRGIYTAPGGVGISVYCIALDGLSSASHSTIGSPQVAAQTGVTWRAVCDMICISTGSSGTFLFAGSVAFGQGVSSSAIYENITAGGGSNLLTLDTTTTHTLDIQEFGASGSVVSATLLGAYWELLN